MLLPSNMKAAAPKRGKLKIWPANKRKIPQNKNSRFGNSRIGNFRLEIQDLVCQMLEIQDLICQIWKIQDLEIRDLVCRILKMQDLLRHYRK